jgi:biotin carboxylase
MSETSGLRVLVLGAPRGVRASLTAARAAGFHVIAADASALAEGLIASHDAHIAAIDDADAVTMLAQRVGAHGIVATTDHAVRAAAAASTRLGLPGITPEAAECATSKQRMRARWQEVGLPQPLVEVVQDTRALHAAVARLGLPVVLKPANALGGGSRGIAMAHDARTLAEAMVAAQSAAPDGVVLVEQCMDARSEHSVELLLHSGVAYVLAIGDKIKTPPPYRVDMAVCYPTALSDAGSVAVGELAAAAARALGIVHGIVHVEIGVTPSGPQLFELGARCGGGATAAPVVPQATGIDEFVEACRLACGLEPAQRQPRWQRGVCYRFIAPQRGRTLSSQVLTSLRQMPGVLDADLWAADPVAGDAIVRTGRDRIGAIVTVGTSRVEALGAAEAALAHLDARPITPSH